jgi:hypothetical protein
VQKRAAARHVERCRSPFDHDLDSAAAMPLVSRFDSASAGKGDDIIPAPGEAMLMTQSGE